MKHILEKYKNIATYRLGIEIATFLFQDFPHLYSKHDLKNSSAVYLCRTHKN